MHYAILNSSGNALEWFEDEAEAKRALAEMLAESPEAQVDLVAFDAPGRPTEPISASTRSAFPYARRVWSSEKRPSHSVGHVSWSVRSADADVLGSSSGNATDDLVPTKA